MLCPQCQTPMEPEAKFCGKCGQRLPAPAPEPAPASDPGPPPAEPVAAAPVLPGVRTRKPLLLAGAAAAVVALTVLGVVLGNQRAQAAWESTAHAQVDALRQENVAKAYGLTSKRFQAAVPDATFALMTRSAAGTLKGSTLIIQSTGKEGDLGWVHGKLVAKDGSAQEVSFGFTKEDGEWRVDEMRSTRAGSSKDGATKKASATWVRKSHDCKVRLTLSEDGLELKPEDDDDEKLYSPSRFASVETVNLPGANFLVITRTTKKGPKPLLLRFPAAAEWKKWLQDAAAADKKAEGNEAEEEKDKGD